MDVYAALADGTRRRIVEVLEEGPLDATSIAERFDISLPAISRHLKRLREAGIVSRRVAAKQRIYRLEADGLAEVEAWLSARRRAWNTRLDALEAHLDGRTAPAEGGAHGLDRGGSDP